MNIKPIHRLLGADEQCSLCELVSSIIQGTHGHSYYRTSYICRKTGVEAHTPCTNADRFYCPVGKDMLDA